MKVILKKIRGKICSTLARYPIGYKWPVFWWRLCGYSIGENTTIGPYALIWSWHHLDTNYLKIDPNVSIGPGVMIIIRSHETSQIEIHSRITNTPSIPGQVTIKEGAWVGAGATILQNVTIGECAVVGAGAVVTKDVESYTVVAGVPAKVIKKLRAKNEV